MMKAELAHRDVIQQHQQNLLTQLIEYFRIDSDLIDGVIRSDVTEHDVNEPMLSDDLPNISELDGYICGTSDPVPVEQLLGDTILDDMYTNQNGQQSLHDMHPAPEGQQSQKVMNTSIDFDVNSPLFKLNKGVQCKVVLTDFRKDGKIYL